MNRREFVRMVPSALAGIGLAGCISSNKTSSTANLNDQTTSQNIPEVVLSKMLYHNPPLILKADRMIDVLGQTTLDDLPDPQPANPIRLKYATPLVERMWRIALRDAESNIVKTEAGTYFGAGSIFGPKVFTRDISFSGALGLNRLYPDLMKSSLEFTRNLRWDLGFIAWKGHDVPDIDVDWDVRYEGPVEMIEHHNTNCYTRRTDDVIWLWCAGDLLKDSTSSDDWAWVYKWGSKFFKRFYDPFYDSSDGLYRGQSTFMDIHSPGHKTSAYPHEWSYIDCVMVKATSTNCFYLRGLEVMAQAARKIDKADEASRWTTRAAKLRTAIRTELRNQDGTFAYYKDRWGKLAPRREALGTALTVLMGVVTGDEAVRALAGYPVSDVGVPTYDPFFEFEAAYHNNTSWPFVVRLFFRALEKSDGKDRSGQCMALVGRVCKNDGFREYIDTRDKSAKGSGSQLWCAAAFIDTCFGAGLVEM